MGERQGSNSRGRLVVAGIVGNIMEWYDFAVFGYFAVTLGHLFFPADNPTAWLLASFAVFAVGFLMRPLGGIAFGWVGDRLGRAPALLYSVMAMALPTFAIGLLPTYASAGMAAPALMVACRVLQGLAVGGEYGNSVVFLVETAPAGRHALGGAWTPFGIAAGGLLGAAIGAVLSTLLSPAAIEEWGWRVPFLLGLLVGAIGFLVRRRLLSETPPAARGFPLTDVLRSQKLALLQGVGLCLVNAVGFYMIFIYFVTWLRVAVHLPLAYALTINTATMVVALGVIPAAGRLADRFGRRPLLLVGACGLLLLTLPLLTLMQSGGIAAILAGELGFVLLIGCYNGVNPAAVAELYPRAVRCSGVSLAYNLAFGMIGGLTPMIATWLVARTGDPLSPAFYLIGAAALSLATALCLGERAFRPLDAETA